MPQIICHILKSSFLDEDSKKNLCDTIPKAKLLLNKILEYQQWDFHCLCHPNFDWESSNINEDCQKHREACLVHYNCVIEDIQRYCGWHFMGDHRHVEEMLKVLKPILSTATFSELCPGYIDVAYQTSSMLTYLMKSLSSTRLTQTSKVLRSILDL